MSLENHGYLNNLRVMGLRPAETNADATASSYIIECRIKKILHANRELFISLKRKKTPASVDSDKKIFQKGLDRLLKMKPVHLHGMKELLDDKGVEAAFKIYLL